MTIRRAFIAALITLALAPNALAAGKAPVFGLRAAGNPKLGYFVYPLRPGAAKTGAVIVSNVGAAAGTVRLFTADGTTGPTSGTVYKTDAKPTGAGSWVKLARTSFRLAPGAHRRVPFTVRVPEGQKAGEWVGGIVAEAARQVATQKPGQKARVQIRIRDLTIVAVQVDVPGPRVVSFDIGDVTTGGTRGFQKVIVHVANQGNVLVKPRGTVTILDSSGAVLQTLPFEMDTFLPDTEIDYPVLLKRALGAGDYTARIALTADGKPFRAKPSFSVSDQDVKQVFTSAAPQAAPATGDSSPGGIPPWAYAAAAAAAVVLLLLLLLLLRRRGRADDDAPAAVPTTFERPGPVAATAASTVPPPPPPVPEEPQPAAAAPPPPAPTARAADHEHDWDVSYDRGELGSDGVWRFPHRCRICGASLLARDVQDANYQT